MGYRVAVVGATGNVGREMFNILEEVKFPVDKMHAIASRKSIGVEVSYGSEIVRCEDLEQFDFSTVDLVLMSAGGAISKAWGEKIGAAGPIVIDNSSHFRMDPDVPLVVPEVNPNAVDKLPKNIIANPNCSTAQLVVVLAPLLISAGLWLREPGLQGYAGFSGVLHGLLYFGVLRMLPRAPALAGTVLLLLIGRQVWEQTPAYNPEYLRGLINGRVMPDAHLFGALAGLLLGAWTAWRARLGKVGASGYSSGNGPTPDA